MRKPRFSKLSLLVWVALAVMPSAAYAQSAIAGVVRDATGAVLPGVTVEVTSPALIEKTRTVVTDATGQYRIIDLRPGTYTATFALAGFSTVKREGIELEAAFTAPVNVEMRVGALEETVTVSGQSPVVDVQSTQRREVVSRQLWDALPTGRNFVEMGNTLPAVSMGRFEIAGSQAMQQGTLSAYGGRGSDQALETDGMPISYLGGGGSAPALYLNDGAYQEFVYQVSSGNADTNTPGIRINQIPREGGNRFSGFGTALYSDKHLQALNVTDNLRARGLETPAVLAKLFDYGGGVGGPVKRDTLWFYYSMRIWAYNNYVANALNPDGSQAIDDNFLQSYDGHLTWQATRKNKITAHYNKSPKYRGHRGLEAGGVGPEATVVQTVPLGYYAQAKWTSTVTNKLLVEAGYSTNFYGFKLCYQPEIRRPSATDPFGDIAKRDLITGRQWNAVASGCFYQPSYKYYTDTSASYITGSHSFKVGTQVTWGHYDVRGVINGDIAQLYRNGVPDSVEVKNSPFVSRTDLKHDWAVYVQDSWTMRRLTLNPGVRIQYFLGEIPEQTGPAGRFVPERHFDKIENIPNWKHVLPRFGASYDLFGGGKTAIKGHVGIYTNIENSGFQMGYNPMVQSTDVRTWNDLNRDDIAQDNELGPPTNASFGVRRNKNPDPDIRRPKQTLYSLGIQHELRPGLGLSASYYRRDYGNLTWTDNLATTFDDYTLITLPDPRGNGQTIPVYNLNVAKRGLINELDSHSDQNTKTYNGIDININARFPNGTLLRGGISTGRILEKTCQGDDPNWVSTTAPGLRFCDQSQYDIPFLTTFKLAGVNSLPAGWRLGWVLQSVPGYNEVVVNYLVNRTIVPTLTLPQVTVRLNEPGEWLDRNNQLDLSLSKTLRIRQVKLKPQVDLFNVLNSSPVLTEVQTFGSALHTPRRILDARLLRFGVQMDF